METGKWNKISRKHFQITNIPLNFLFLQTYSSFTFCVIVYWHINWTTNPLYLGNKQHTIIKYYIYLFFIYKCFITQNNKADSLLLFFSVCFHCPALPSTWISHWLSHLVNFTCRGSLWPLSRLVHTWPWSVKPDWWSRSCRNPPVSVGAGIEAGSPAVP